ncbi:alpha/beta hydrolase family protein [Promethearchaeum syntrophicum]|uniref:Alpha/beta hydrolase family protein n=1 Tax=Promethearchaeum syntrophicum TaxID=2594042 RepID=A0A5B9DF65_9ARCH|nr:alpha/beta fold hydrolase [Candidatus Prometheoarchaeum syntrophicum]QEE17918.1 Acylamino-acid-releasing enzyme [Candidatus Prometheoarchaeum syntrophicum]
MSWLPFAGGLLSGIILEKLQKYFLRGKRLRTLEKKELHWIRSSQINRENEIITMPDGKKLQAYIYSSDLTPEIAPSVLFLHGFGGFAQDFNFEGLLSSICLAGYRVFAYDFRSSGNSRKKGEPSIFGAANGDFIQLIFKDVVTAIDWMYQHEGIDKANLSVIGGSLGGGMVLSSALHDERIKKLIGFCAPYDFSDVFRDGFIEGSIINRLYFKILFKKLTDVEDFLLKVHDISPIVKIDENFNYENRVFLAHSRNDDVIAFEKHFLKNVEKMKIPTRNTIIFDKGGHEFTGNSAPLIARILYWLGIS